MKKREDMISDVHRRIEEYEAEKRMKKARAGRIAAAAAPVCAAALAGVFIWKAGILSPADDHSESTIIETSSENAKVPAAVITSENVTAAAVTSQEAVTDITLTEKASSEQAAFSGDDEQTLTLMQNTSSAEEGSSAEQLYSGDRLGDAFINGEYYLQIFPEGETFTPDSFIGSGSDFRGYYADCGIESEFYTVKESTDIVAVELGNGGTVYLKKQSAEETPSGHKLIDDYPQFFDGSYSVPEAGKCGYTMSVYSAMEEYGDDADYLVAADIFKNNEPVFDPEELEAEAQRLEKMGILAKTVTEQDQSGEYTYILLNLTCDQLKGFPANEEYAYFFRFHRNSPMAESGYAE